MTLKSRKKEFLIKEGLWKGYNLWSLFEKAKTPFSWHKELFNYAKKKIFYVSVLLSAKTRLIF